MDLHFSRAHPLDRRDSLLFGEKLIFGKVEVATYFSLFLKWKIKQKKKNPKKVTP